MENSVPLVGTQANVSSFGMARENGKQAPAWATSFLQPLSRSGRIQAFRQPLDEAVTPSEMLSQIKPADIIWWSLVLSLCAYVLWVKS